MVTTKPIPYPSSASPALGGEGFGVVVEGLDLAKLDSEHFEQIRDLVYQHSIVVIRGISRDQWSPEAQYKLTRAFDPNAIQYGHGDNKTGSEKRSILHPDLKTIPSQPQVQLIGNGPHRDPYITRGLEISPTDPSTIIDVPLKHPHHRTFHREPIPSDIELTVGPNGEHPGGLTRFYRWHIDAALYGLAPPVATTLYALKVPDGPKQLLRYDDAELYPSQPEGGDSLPVPLGTTAFVSGKKMFNILPPELKSLAVRSKVKYAPHPYVWMSKSRAVPTGLGLYSEGLEMDKKDLPEWEEGKVKVFPMTWKNPLTGELHLQVHPCGAETLIVDPLPSSSEKREGALYPDGAEITDLKTVRDILYKIQRPAISPELVYPHDWKEGDLCIFHNRGVLHSVVGAFTPEQQRAFWQCNLAASHDPVGPNEEDVKKYA